MFNFSFCALCAIVATYLSITCFSERDILFGILNAVAAIIFTSSAVFLIKEEL